MRKQESSGARAYRQILFDARKHQLRLTQANLRRLMRTFEIAAENIAAQLIDLPSIYFTPEESVTQAAMRETLRNIDAILAILLQDYAALLDAGMLEIAQAAAEREQRIGNFRGAPNDPSLLSDQEKTVVTADGAEVSVRFGRVAGTAVERLASRYYRDGLRLSDRLYRLNAETRKTIEDVLVAGIAEGASAQKVGARLVESLVGMGAANPGFQAMRIARTELNHADREAHILSVQTDTGALKEWVQGIKWNLSFSHPEPDICDIYASHDSGLGAGVYLPKDVPVDHPHGLCFLTTVLKAYPEVAGPTKPARPFDVPESQILYYAEQLGDPIAEAALSGLS